MRRRKADAPGSLALSGHVLVALGFWCLAVPPVVSGHDAHTGPTYEVTAEVELVSGQAKLDLSVIDSESQGPTAARFSLSVDGSPYVPAAVGRHGLRFVSIHTSKHQRFVATYARGTGVVEVPLPSGARGGVVSVVKGFDYLPDEIPFRVVDGEAIASVKLRRWNDLREQGWWPAEEHLHYDRTEAAHDKDWLTILAAEDLALGHFLVVKGGNLPGVWASQFAYGPAGEASDGRRRIRPGEEYRDGHQGHINLLGITEVIPPIIAGGRDYPWNYPPLYDVFVRARELGGLVGPAHGTALGRNPTGVMDTLLGAVDFFELANTHLYKVDVWYRLMNCGYLTPPAAGTDLPNYPFRDPWQPLLGETRMVVRTGDKRDFESWKEAVKRGEVFITSGPMITLSVGGAGPGGTVRLPNGGGQVRVEAELSGPRPLESLEVVHCGEPITAAVQHQRDGRVDRLRIRQTITVAKSGWLAARGVGVRKEALLAETGIEQHAIAHTAAVRVLVGNQPITSRDDARFLLDHLESQKETYRAQARYEKDVQRQRMMELFDRAIAEISPQVNK